jgi:hypothetical protein
MFIILPVFWVGALGWAGVKAGSVLSGLQTGTDGVQKAGAQGGGVAKQAIGDISNKGG